MATKRPEKLSIRYIALEDVRQWDRNPKGHDIDSLIESFRRYGFKDPPKLEPTLNKGKGGIVEGNGRFEALAKMRAAGESPPRGVSATWHVPILVGVDAASESEAASYAVDHNNLPLVFAEFSGLEVARLWDVNDYSELLEELKLDDALPLTVAPSDPLLEAPDFQPEPSNASRASFDELSLNSIIICPHCGKTVEIDLSR